MNLGYFFSQNKCFGSVTDLKWLLIYNNHYVRGNQNCCSRTGYVGLSIATLLAQHHPVTAVDVIPEKVETLNRKQSPIQDEYIEKYLKEKELNLTATLDGASAYRDADFIVIAAPTNYDPVKNYFDTHHIEDVIDPGIEC